MAKKEKGPEIIWENNKVIGETPMSDKTKMVVCVSVRSGVKYINFRQFYKRKDEVWKPSLNGFCLPIEVPFKEGTEVLRPTGPLIELIQAALEAAPDMPIYDEANVVYKLPKEDK